MNLLHLKYAVEVANAASISKAAENLYMGQPNLSRAVKELEDSLGISIFIRNKKGISVTPEGEEFLNYARQILRQVDEVEALYHEEKAVKQKFSICVPRASYISKAFMEFAKHINLEQAADLFYKETNSRRTIQNVLKEEYNLGIVRYQSVFDQYFKKMFFEKAIVSELITEFSYVLLVSKESPLAEIADVTDEDLSSYIEIQHADPYVPSLPLIDVKKAEFSKGVNKHIFVFERGSQFGLLEAVPNTFMWVSPIPDDMLAKYHLVQKHCSMNQDKIYRDVLIYRKGYSLSELDKDFITEVCYAKREIIPNR